MSFSFFSATSFIWHDCSFLMFGCVRVPMLLAHTFNRLKQFHFDIHSNYLKCIATKNELNLTVLEILT